MNDGYARSIRRSTVLVGLETPDSNPFRAMTGVYEHALGDAAADLNPRVRDRYGIGPEEDAVCVGRGEMDISRGTLALPALFAMTTQDLLFPEAGENVPFTVTTTGYRNDAGYEVLATRRAFHFESVERRFDSLTVWDGETRRLFDFLGRRGTVASRLHPRVDDGALVVEGGRQWLRVGGRYVRLPGPLAADVTVRDRYDDDQGRFHVTARIENAVAGHILTYRGAFTQETKPRDAVAGDFRPDRGISRLPPP